MKLTEQKCVPCEVGGLPLTDDQVSSLMKELPNGWEVVEKKHIVKDFEFKDFKEAIAFVNKVAELAESEGHHPDLNIHYNKVSIDLWTHAVGGLSQNDFILASKIENI